jgi:hypothetical protein
MNRSIRCQHGFCREVVACPQCGDTDPSDAYEARNNSHRNKRRNRTHVTSRLRTKIEVPPGYGSADGHTRSEAQRAVSRGRRA